jgi:hypothetical protein
MSNDSKAMYEWYAQWANVMELTVSPASVAQMLEQGAELITEAKGLGKARS